MKLLVVDDQTAVPYIFTTFLSDLMWERAGGTPETLPDILVAHTWNDAVAAFDAQASNIVGVVVDALLEIDLLNRGADIECCGPAFFWHVRRFSPHIPVVIFSMGGLAPFLREATGLNDLPPPSEGNYSYCEPLQLRSLDWFTPITIYARSRVHT